MPYKHRGAVKERKGGVSNVGNKVPQQSGPRKTQLPRSAQVQVELLQTILNVFRNTFSLQFDSTLPELLQEVKHHLYNRDFDKAFGQKQYLEVYAMRWSPSRALAYTNILLSSPIIVETLRSSTVQDLEQSEEHCLPGYKGLICSVKPEDSSTASRSINDLKGRSSQVICMGAGAGAEIVALAALLKHLEHGGCGDQTNLGFKVTIVDVADWRSITSRLHSAVTTSPPLSQYASTVMKAANRPLAYPSDYSMHYLQCDILGPEFAEVAASFKNVALVTFMFTLNEIYNSSISGTTRLLLSLSKLLSRGTLLLVVDSPGSYSTVKLGSLADPQDADTRRKYPMQWLLDHTLLGPATDEDARNPTTGGSHWEKLASHESEWFRLLDGLRYPIELEDMRYQSYLYRRL